MVAIAQIQPADCPTLLAEPIAEIVNTPDIQKAQDQSLMQTARIIGSQTVYQLNTNILSSYPNSDNPYEVMFYGGIELIKLPARKMLHAADAVLKITLGIEHLALPV